MTLTEHVVALQDLLGVTDKEAMFIRMVNEAKDRYSDAEKWPHLIGAQEIGFETDGEVALSSTMRSLVWIEDADGKEVGEVDRRLWSSLYNPSTATATTPTRFVKRGNASGVGINLGFWPQSSALSTGTAHGQKQIPDIASGASTGKFQYVPDEHSPAIQEAAKALYHEEQKEWAAAEASWNKFKELIARWTGKLPRPAPHDQ